MKVLSIISILLLSFVSANADVTKKQARKAIATSAGMSLPSSAVRVDRIVASGNSAAEVTAQLELVFRLERDEKGQWRLKELRTAEAQWEDVDALTQALKVDLQQDKCDTPKNEFGRVKPEDLSIKRSRCLIASLFAVELPSDSVRIKEVAALSLGSQPSAVAVSLVQADFKLTRDSGSWRATEIHSGTRGWVRLDALPSGVDVLKRERTTERLNAIAVALDAFRRDRGSFVVTDKHSVLIDHLSPHYLSRVMRLDAWNRPFHYQGDKDHFTVRSVGADGKENTPDDLLVSR
jgi:hypothetical protein